MRDLPAFPTENNGIYFSGLTKRELFAAMAMQGLLANWSDLQRDGFLDHEIAEFAVQRADALIQALK